MNSRLLTTALFCLLGPALSWAQIDEGLVAHWPFDETSGTIANDTSGNGLDGTVVGATWTQGRIGNALRFDGVNDFVQVPGVGAPPPARIGALSRGTIAFWVRFRDPDNLLNTIGFPMFYFGTQPGSNEAWDLEVYIGHAEQFTTDDRRIYYTYHRNRSEPDPQLPPGQPLLCFNSRERLEENTWYHYAVVIGPDGNTGYLSGREMTDRIYNFGDPSRTDFFDDVRIQEMLTMGFGWSSPARDFTYFNGWLDDVRIYNRPLSAAEIRILAGNGGGNGAGPVYEAEDAVVISPAFVGDRHSGFTGTGFVRYPSSGGSVRFTVDVPDNDMYDLNFRYSIDGSQWGAEVRVDGAVIDSRLEFPETGDWTNWQNIATSAAMSAGSHDIAVTSVVPVRVNLDHLELIGNGGLPPPGGGITYQMEDGAISGDAFIGTRSSGFTGDGYVRYRPDGATVEHAVDVPAAGAYELTFRYSLLSGQVAGEVTVDGQTVDPNLVFPTTGSWTNWQTVSTTVDLDDGTQSVALSLSGLGINVDSMVVTPR